jgi:ATP-independent RNA helicase DbpA
MKSEGFARSPLSPELLLVLTRLGYNTPTPIQAASIDPLLAGKDFVGQSKTGSGKTAAFAIPCLERLSTETREPQVLVLCPTRELCEQISREIRRIGAYKKDLQVVPLSGGHPIYLQLKPLRHGAQVIVGTPGRIEDHLRRKTLDLSKIKIVVLDEADRMLDMGFRDKIEMLLAETPRDRQTIFFSATFPETIEAMSKNYQRDPEFVTIADEGSVASQIRQEFYQAPESNKSEVLCGVLEAHAPGSCLVFCNQKIRVDEVTEVLKSRGYVAGKIHGDMVQSDREKVMAKFKNETIKILVATDVAARGLDVKELDAVVNYDLPNDPAVYVHRIGRTGRAGMTGLALSLVNDREGTKCERISHEVGIEVKPKKPPRFSGRTQTATSAMETLYISGGRKDKIRPGDILGALTGEAGGLAGTLVGKIEVQDHHTYVAIARSHSRVALKRLQGGKIKGRRFAVSLVV